MFKIVSRDVHLLQGLYDNTLLSFRQIQSSFFANRSKAVVHNRLSKLIKAGLVERFKLGRIFHKQSLEEIGVVYRIGKFGLKHLGKSFSDLVPINSSSLYHDLVLSDVLLKLKSSLANKKLVHGKLFGGAQKLKRMPDAIIFDSLNNIKIALELELTAKSEKRYRQLLTEYRLSKDFEKVLYITANDVVVRKIKSVLGIKNGFEGNVLIPSKFIFMDLSSILSGGINESEI